MKMSEHLTGLESDKLKLAAIACLSCMKWAEMARGIGLPIFMRDIDEIVHFVSLTSGVEFDENERGELVKVLGRV